MGSVASPPWAITRPLNRWEKKWEYSPRQRGTVNGWLKHLLHSPGRMSAFLAAKVARKSVCKIVRNVYADYIEISPRRVL
jgi:hypothetical protein